MIRHRMKQKKIGTYYLFFRFEASGIYSYVTKSKGGGVAILPREEKFLKILKCSASIKFQIITVTTICDKQKLFPNAV